MAKACSTNRENMNGYWLLIVKPEGKRPMERPSGRWMNYIRMDLGEKDGVVLTKLIWLRIETRGWLLRIGQ
jgi:hypothetical protein